MSLVRSALHFRQKDRSFVGKSSRSIGLLNQEPKFQPRRPCSQNHSYRETTGVEAERGESEKHRKLRIGSWAVVS